MKIRTLNQFQDALDAEFGWRHKEIIDLKSSVRSSKSLAQATLIRAGLALLYAHWEGFVKKSSEIYVQYLNGQRVIYSDIKSPLVVMGLKSHLNSLRESGVAPDNVATLDFLRNKMQDRFSISLSGAIKTESNLSSVIFKNIASSLCIPINNYELKFNLIDESLLSRRNKIAHGEYLDISSDEWRSLADEILQLLKTYKADLENAAMGASYRI